MQPNTLSVDEFFQEEYPRLLSYCHSRWNGNGEDVLHQTYIILKERYSCVSHTLFQLAAREAARALGLHRRELPLHENIPYSEQSHESKEDPRMERLQDVLAHMDVDVEEALRRRDIFSRVRAEYHGQLSFEFEREEGR